MPRWMIVLLLMGAAAFWGLEGGERLAPDQIEDGAVRVDDQAPSTGRTEASFLPPEALRTVDRIVTGGPHPYPQDGSVFFNREGLLPERSRGHYREYTVDTPGLSHRGARRIVTGGQPPRDWYYTDDHYQSFRTFEVMPR